LKRGRIEGALSSLSHEVGEKGPTAAPFARRWEVRAGADAIASDTMLL
jgi:hypothetical protein